MTDATNIHPFLEDSRLRKLERLRKRAQFLQTQRKGRRANHAFLVIYASPNGLAFNRLGLTTSRKVGSAVMRNRWRRLLREAFRQNKRQLPQGYDLVIIVKPQQQPPSYEQLVSILVDRVQYAVDRLQKV